MTFFHLTTSSRRYRNRKTRIKANEEELFTKEVGIKKVIQEHYDKPFTSENPDPDDNVLDCVPLANK